ncbi:GNAT family N-acetyltransferase [Cochleicola gelatinilyticus]|uniref:N-acetyltransferase domain-containing protein n=1 Tax=Cochleicola gelatinilyticus TaxID=1763537 RepID=A0A167JFE8_9FLAO|nr:GNAT family N-acetyltransferase [Cochleicola gelatinilyticus]OAB80621.1 hypothetical protein ULVI_04150 [Cochleicola gelatinilyticus]
MVFKVEHNTDGKGFEIHVDGYTAFVDYKLFPGGIALTHTEVPKEISGQGVASALAKHALEYAQKNDLKVKPYCSFIKAYIDEHLEYQKISLFHNKED